MEISLNEIKRLEKLSALRSDDEKLKSLAKDFEQIFEFVEQIKGADIDEKVEYTRVLDVSDLRPDEQKESMTQNEILSNAPEKGEGAFIVPKVVD